MICMIYRMCSALDLYHADPAQPLTTAGEELDDLGHDLSDLSVRGVERLIIIISISIQHPPVMCSVSVKNQEEKHGAILTI